MKKEVNKVFKEKGITLIALVVTIVILIILATISINAVLVENGLIKRAEKAAEHQANAEKSESETIDDLLYQAGVATGEIVANPYDKDAWTYAWVCDNGTWGEKLEAGTAIEEGEGIVVAKIYETGKKITPPDLDIGEETPITFSEGNEYVMVIEGQGEMGALLGEGKYYAWMEEALLFLGGESEIFTIGYTTEVIICDGVTSIAKASFAEMTISLKNVTIGNSVTSIGEVAFDFCSSLTNIIIPEGVISIGEETFRGCSSLTNVTIPDSVTNIGNRAFVGCSNLTNLTIGNRVTSIGQGVFAECTSLTNVTIPESVTNIGPGSFNGCSSLTNVTIPDSVTSIGNSAFGNCSSLTSIVIPDSVISIGNSAFNYCNNLSIIKIYANNPESITFGGNDFGEKGSISSSIDGNVSYNCIAQNSVIYVLSEEMKTKLTEANAYYSDRTTVQVVTLEEMNAI